MKQKKIGLLMAALDSDAMQHIYNGITQKAVECGISTFSFMIFPSAGASGIYNSGEYYAFDVMDYESFDGFIVALNTFNSQKVKDEIARRLEKVSVPVISLDHKLQNSYNIITSNCEPMRELVTHLIRVHGKKKINYIGGPRINEESNERLRGYKEALLSNGMTYEPERVYYGNFYVQDGKEALEYFERQESAKEYDALVCANDLVAISVYSELKMRGIEVPKDVTVTGFDYIRESTYMEPNLTTIAKPEFEIGAKAVELLQELFEGKKPEQDTFVESKVVLRESCGCKRDKENRTDYFRESYFRNFSSDILGKMDCISMIEELIYCENLAAYLEVLKRYVKKLNPPGFYLCIYRNYYCELCGYDVPEQKQGTEQAVVVKVPICYQNGEFVKHESITEKMIAPGIEEGMHQYLCSPIHFRDHNFGYVLFQDSDYPMTRDRYREWLNGINNTLSSLRDRLLLNKAIRKLDHMYVLDNLTGLYNRFGLERYYAEFQQYCADNHEPLLLMFADVNGLKHINDVYGHEHGDHVIYAIARSLERLGDDRLIAARYGGDEFIVLGKGIKEEEIDTLRVKLQQNLERENDTNREPYRISASIGFYIKEPDQNEPLIECIRKADERMYEEKKAYHQRMGIND